MDFGRNGRPLPGFRPASAACGKNPVYGDIAVYETDGVSNHRLTVIDSKTYAKKFSKKFANSIVSISFSAKGKYLFAGTTAVNGTFVLNARTGTVIKKQPMFQELFRSF